jgi:hypothetical protein
MEEIKVDKLREEIYKQYPTISEAQLTVCCDFAVQKRKSHFFWPNVFYLDDQITTFCIFRGNNEWYIAFIDDSYPQINESKHTLKTTVHENLKDINYQVLVSFEHLSGDRILWCYDALEVWINGMQAMGIDMSFKVII